MFPYGAVAAAVGIVKRRSDTNMYLKEFRRLSENIAIVMGVL